MPTVLIQTGHVAPREPGFEDATGATGEQEVVKVIAAQLVTVLAADSRFAARVIPGKVPADVRSGGFEVDAFISLHCDGSKDKSKRGWGIGYPSGAVNKKLSDLVGVEIAKIHPSARMRDNYTSDMSGYYGYSRVPTPGPEILVEHGFVSNAAERKWLIEEADAIARAEYRALLAFYGLPVKPPKPVGSWITPEEAQAAWNPSLPIWDTLPGPRGKPEWFWQAEKELQRRRAALRGTV
jgi:N-acetylmuramoyl-L-alanine amidase